MTTNLQQRFETLYKHLGLHLGYKNKEKSQAILAFIESELTLLAEEVEKQSKQPKKTVTWAGLVEAAFIIRTWGK